MTCYFKNLFAVIQNGQLSKKKFIYHYNKWNLKAFLKVLWDNGFITGYTIVNWKKLKIFLKYKNSEPVIKLFKLMSKPAFWIFVTFKQLCKIETSKLFIVISTNKGLFTIFDCKKLWLGGELICLIK